MLQCTCMWVSNINVHSEHIQLINLLSYDPFPGYRVNAISLYSCLAWVWWEYRKTRSKYTRSNQHLYVSNIKYSQQQCIHSIHCCCCCCSIHAFESATSMCIQTYHLPSLCDDMREVEKYTGRQEVSIQEVSTFNVSNGQEQSTTMLQCTCMRVSNIKEEVQQQQQNIQHIHHTRCMYTYIFL